MTTEAPAMWKSPEHAEEHLVRRHTGEPSDWTARVAARMFGEQRCVMHAAYEIAVEDYDSGRIPTVPCPYCAGRADPRIGFHHLCRARAEHGRETPRLDVGPGPCGCYHCSKGRPS